MIDIKEFGPEIMEKYYVRLNDHIEMSSVWRGLQTKAEAGTTKSEKGYQMIAKSMAGRIARDLGYNSEKAEVICACIGMYFPKYGQEGKRVIEQYLSQKDLDVEASTLAIDTIEDYITKKMPVAMDLDVALREYYSDTPIDGLQIPEVGVARVCQDAISKIKIVERFSNIDGGELLFNTSEDIINASREAGKPTPSVKLNQLVSSVSGRIEDRMTQDEKDEMIAHMEEFIDFYGKEGIYRYVRTDGR